MLRVFGVYVICYFFKALLSGFIGIYGYPPMAHPPTPACEYVGVISQLVIYFFRRFDIPFIKLLRHKVPEARNALEFVRPIFGLNVNVRV